jgi:hypothetical protein
LRSKFGEKSAVKETLLEIIIKNLAIGKKKILENLANFLNNFSMKNSVGRSKFGENSPVKKENTGTAQIFYIIVFWVF